ncbi:MAG TPA: SulP family inorganic anion transporter [Desulfuromonadaceae bacterium]
MNRLRKILPIMEWLPSYQKEWLRFDVATSSTIAILASSTLAAVASGGDATRLLSASATLSLLVGAFLLLGGLLRLGALANLISDPVLIGFKAGIGLAIVLDQVPKLLDVHITKAGFFQDIVSILRHLPETSLPIDARPGDAGPHVRPKTVRAATAGPIDISLVAMNPYVLEVIQRSPLWERLGDERMFFTLDEAVERFQLQAAVD